MDTDLTSAERRWQRRPLFHEHRSHKWRWVAALLVLTTLTAIAWLAIAGPGLNGVVNELGALYQVLHSA